MKQAAAHWPAAGPCHKSENGSVAGWARVVTLQAVATGLWPVRPRCGHSLEDGPQGRGYNAIRTIRKQLFKSAEALLGFTRPRNRDNEFAVFLGDEVCRFTGRATVCVFFLDRNDELFHWLECQANFPPGGGIHRRGCLLRFVGCKIDKLDLGNLFPGLSGLHHFVKAENFRVGALRIEE